MKKIKVLIVDDSVLFRSQIQLALTGCEDLEVVATAANGKIGLDKAVNFDVDLMVLDLEMPVMDGIETVKAIKEKNLKTKIILFSSMSRVGAEKTLEAMKLGALDFVAKPVPDGSTLTPDEKIRNSLLPKILSLFSLSPVALKTVEIKVKEQPRSNLSWEKFSPSVLVIASSTGGPNALTELFTYLKEPLPFPILITQHMPPVFTTSLAKKLGEISGKVSNEGKHGEVIIPNQIYVAPGSFHMSITGNRHQQTIVLDEREPRNYVRPCADFLFESAAKIFKQNTLGVVLTGMGRDGADGCKVIKSDSGAVIIQDQASSVVFGMPGAVHDAGDFDLMASPIEIAQKILALARNMRTNYVA